MGGSDTRKLDKTLTFGAFAEGQYRLSIKVMVPSLVVSIAFL